MIAFSAVMVSYEMLQFSVPYLFFFFFVLLHFKKKLQNDLLAIIDFINKISYKYRIDFCS